MKIITNTSRAKALAIWYGAFAALVCVFMLTNNLYAVLVGYAFLFNVSNGFFAFACFRNLNIHKIIKFFFFVIAVASMFFIYRNYIDIEVTNMFFSLLGLFTNIIGVLVIGISRLSLTKSQSFFILNFSIFPVAVLISALFSMFEIWFSIIGVVIITVIIVAFVWYAGGAGYYESQEMYFDYKTTDGRIIRHQADNRYSDDFGRRYELSRDGFHLYEL